MPRDELFVRIANIIVCVLIVVGNVLILTALALSRKLRKTTTPFVASLAAADLYVGLSFGIDSIVNIYVNADHKENIIADIFLESAIYCSLLNLVAIATDRFLSVVIALRYNAIVTKKVIYWILVGTWTIALLLQPLSQHFYLDKTNTDTMVSRKFHIALYVWCVGMICLLYGYIGITAWHQKRRIQALQIPMSDERDRVVSDSMKVTRVLMTVVGGCAVLWLPHAIMSLYIITHPKILLTYAELFAPTVFGMFNSAINIVIYSLMNAEFRSTFIQLIKCQLKNM
ncbi:hypothetical protein CAPTEDRAFT_111841 [Capitella teleta]|uniref:G-protein coupled receptors family 1 profile domain-containing protein n=1 Tax=Capitella teleta TaxID=283909 RepID=X1YV64_CAPTE|nr:hypothetical protein CAPTEDRAFT_111841 [Capitella teleta]|eukprot:ELU04640.1 hypothetical protein CAPTEDRAFT_111841 [Capitella teleta]